MANATVQLEQIRKDLTAKEGKYLTFALGPEEYGLEILKVREIIGYMAITAVPQMPPYVKGVINLRGQVIRSTVKSLEHALPKGISLAPTCIVDPKRFFFNDIRTDLISSSWFLHLNL